MTHSEFALWTPRDLRARVPFSSCDGEMVQTILPPSMGEIRDDQGRVVRVVELWHCCKCQYTIHTARTPHGPRHITSGYSAPSIPPLKIAGFN